MRGITGQQPRTVWPWRDVEHAYKTVDDDGKRWVLVWDEQQGTVLAPWEGTE
jgi:hypothetical protein